MRNRGSGALRTLLFTVAAAVPLAMLLPASPGADCHGSETPRDGTRVMQNEYLIWSSRDRHAGAYDLLLEEQSRRIARNLGLGRPEQADQCLDCHAHNVEKQAQGAIFRPSEGVGCEACHGNSSSWLGTHAAGNADRGRLGMRDPRGLEERAELCLGCHLGTARRSVGHALIAAGHPDLFFELDSFSALMPSHWQPDAGPWEGVRQWAVGQAVSLRQSMRLLSQRARGPGWDAWPDFADFECGSCHHSLSVAASGDDYSPSLRQARGFEGLPGLPSWDSSRATVFREFLRTAMPNAAQQLDSRLAALSGAMKRAMADRRQAAAQADAVAAWCDRILPHLKSMDYNQDVARGTIVALSRRAPQIAAAGRRAAEQAVMAVDSLYAALSANTRPSESLDAHINDLYRLLQSSSRYDSRGFAGLLSQSEAKLEPR